MSRSDPQGALLEAVFTFYDGSGRVGNANVDSMLDAVRTALLRATPLVPVPHAIQASKFLEPALPQTTLGAAVAAAAPLFQWRQNPNYTATDMGAAFMDGYGYVEVAGPKDALFHAPAIRVGLLLLAPGLHYPLHTHPAEEIYHPLTDGSWWRRGEEAWRVVPASHAIHHPPMTPHETKAPNAALLALYCWRGETTTEARLTR